MEEQAHLLELMLSPVLTVMQVNFAGATEVFCTVPGAKIGLPTPEEYGSSSAPKIITVKVGSKTGNHPYQSAGGSVS